MDRILPSSLADLDDAIRPREQALRVFLLTLEPTPPDLGDAPFDLDAVRHRVMNTHPDLVGDILRAMSPTAVLWLFAQNYFLSPERMPGDLELLYILLRDSIVFPNVHDKAVSVFVQIDTHRDSPLYLKCMYLIVPMFPDDFSDEQIWDFLTTAWKNDDVWLTMSVLQNHYGMGQKDALNMGVLEDLLELALPLIDDAPKTTIYFARLVELETIRDDLTVVAREGIRRLNDRAKALSNQLQPPEDAPLSSQSAIDPDFHRRKCRRFTQAPGLFEDEWQAHLNALLQKAPAIPDDAHAAIAVLRKQYHVCHECTDMLPSMYLEQVQTLCANSEGGRAYMRLVLKPKRKVRAIERVVREYLANWKPGDDHSTAIDVGLYLSTLASREIN